MICQQYINKVKATSEPPGLSPGTGMPYPLYIRAEVKHRLLPSLLSLLFYKLEPLFRAGQPGFDSQLPQFPDKGS